MFYTYNQNNSSGFFVLDDTVTHHVIVEADSHEDANSRAEGVGLYFDGCRKGFDCSCCGDRWSRQWPDEGDPEPMIYDTPVASFTEMFAQKGQRYAYVYYKDGSKVAFGQEGDA